MTTSHWEHFEHEADIGVRGVGPTLAEAFAGAALAMTAVITDPASIAAKQSLTIDLDQTDPEYLLVDWLNALIYEMSVQKLLFCRFDVEIQSGHLHAVVWGERVDIARHAPAVEIKGATLTALRVAQQKGEWVAECVVDV